MHSSRMRTVRNRSRLMGWGLCVCSWGVCLVRWGSGPRVGVSAPGGGVWSGRGGIPVCTEADPPSCGQTDRCKNITFATSLRTVINATKLNFLLIPLSVNDPRLLLCIALRSAVHFLSSKPPEASVNQTQHILTRYPFLQQPSFLPQDAPLW